MIPGMDRLGAGAVDRAGCHAWCGKTYAAIPIGCEESRDYLDSRSFDIGTGMRWCSPRCRDLRLPPLAPASPANVSPPSPAPGQRWEIVFTGDDPSHVNVGDILPGGRVRWIPGRLTNHLVTSEAGAWPLDVIARAAAEGRARYLGPTHTTPSAVDPAPLPMVAALGSGPKPCNPLCGQPRSTWKKAGQVLSYLPIGHEKQADPVGWCCEAKWNRGRGSTSYSYVPGDFTIAGIDYGINDRASWARRPIASTPVAAPTPKPTRTPGITCRHCLTTSAGGVDHQPTCVVMREQGPSAVAAAPGVQRDSFDDLVDEFDLLPDACR